ncbi:prepilin-type N-terminal cleavage/methylation domain-containing protein [Bacillus sp. BRMEA1]|uniref:type IV pilus modification PilV family protein n=1 Tax=Neobacillus endophyticus TaxID=2738405 RepID=UPI0015676424|nr:type II secretion system protein [Neobacillus endophyticus]NRD76014.1 prepilin-type N-terminal cleavage/methylation domain-containing protein [Neobacillus endophyticus]
MKKYFHNQKGLTLIEILISIVLLTVILTSFMGFFTQSAIFNKHNNVKLDTIQTAQKIKNLINTNMTKNILLNDNKIDALGTIQTTKLDAAYLSKYFNPQTSYNYWVELSNSLIPNSTTKLIQVKIVVQDPKNINNQSVTYTYIRG